MAMTRRNTGPLRLDLSLAGDPIGRALCWVLALLGYLAVVGGIALVLLSSDIGEWDRSLGSSLTLQIPAEVSAARIETILALLRQTAGVRGARLLELAETAKLLEPWLGPAAATATLPIPRLVDVQVDPKAAIDIADLRQKLSSVAANTQIDDHRQWLDNARHTAIRLASLVAAGIAIVILSAAVLTAALTRARLAVRRETIELLHLIGAADGDVARPFQADALRRGLLGGAIGAAAALVTWLVVGGVVPAHAMPAVVASSDWRLWGVTIAVALVAGLVAMAAARITALRRLSLMP
jgi:cell division transport system permease protein